MLAEAITYAVDHGADVINMSLATPRQTRLLRSVLAKVCDDPPEPGEEDFPATANPNLVVVVAAGNTSDFTPMYPAAENLGGLLGVAASTQQDILATFSTRGSWIRVAAPGQGIVSTVPNGLYATWSGTSMAAPLVAGEAALLRAAFPTLTNKKTVDHIVRTAASIPGPVQARIDAGAALTTQPQSDASPTPTSTPTPTPTPTPTAPTLLARENSTRAIALEAVTFLAEPIPPLASQPFGTDNRTRVMLFATNLGLLPGEGAAAVTAEAEDATRTRYPLTVEYAGTVAGFDWMSEVIVRLNDNLGDVGDVLVGITVHGLASNRVRIGIGHIGGGPPDDPTSARANPGPGVSLWQIALLPPPRHGRTELIQRMRSGELSPTQTLRASIAPTIVFDAFFHRAFAARQDFRSLRRDPEQASLTKASPLAPACRLLRTVPIEHQSTEPPTEVSISDSG